MEFLVRIEIALPPDTDAQRRAELVAAEAERSAALRAAGNIVRLWRVPGRWASVGIWSAADPTELHSIVSGLPLWPWMDVEVTPLAQHPLERDGE